VLNRKGLKFLAIMLASVTWLYIRETTSHEEILDNIPVEIVTPDSWAIQERSVNTVSVSFRGSQADLRALSKDQIRVQADARGKNIEPNMILKLDRSNVSAPRSVRAMYVDPGEIVLTLDRESDKQVPVRVDLLGQLPEGFDVESTNITPSVITVHGPERRLANVDFVRTVPIDMEGRIRSFQINRALVTPGENWQARMDVDKVRVEFTIVERTVRRDFTNVPVKVLLPAGETPAVSFSPSSVNVSLKGRSDAISNLSLRVLHAYIDCSSLKPGDSQDLGVEVPTPSGVNIIAIDPPRIRVALPEPLPPASPVAVEPASTPPDEAVLDVVEPAVEPLNTNGDEKPARASKRAAKPEAVEE